MVIWQAAAAGGDITVRAWYGGNGTGLLDLFERSLNGPWSLIGSNPSVAQPLAKDVPAGNSWGVFSLRTFAGTPGGGALPVFMTVAQGGQVLQALDSAGNPANGANAPFGDVQLQPNAPNAAAQFYEFDVNFS